MTYEPEAMAAPMYVLYAKILADGRLGEVIPLRRNADAMTLDESGW